VCPFALERRYLQAMGIALEKVLGQWRTVNAGLAQLHGLITTE
jgi:hypothetical protein